MKNIRDLNYKKNNNKHINCSQNNRKIILLLFFYIIILKTNLFVQENKIKFEHISTNNGLSESTITSIFQDKIGFLWIGTEDGLNKYDGYKFTIYKIDSVEDYGLSCLRRKLLACWA